ncbi:hypothetical protein [Salinisphaera sp.]|uniref:hypothetical protein n=1 Tax=Salinisphaera sp. TaxID=1914330 RepID=UPI000C3A44F3|nr:hypothetical protein [Salinisphaera sp.]MBS62239.1 hypothetical protein [Salinisphaera sp.]
MITTRTSATVWGTALLLCGASPWAFAQLDENALDAAPNSDSPPEMQQQSAQPQGADKIYGSVGVDYASHFVSYGGDVWGGGNDFYGSQSTTFAYIDLGADLPNGFALTFGAWSDINNNTDEQTIGGNIQEIDVYGGLTYTTGAVTLGAIYQQWYYGGDTERVLDLSIGYDDSGLWGGDFALNPSFLTHIRVNGQEGQDDGAVFVAAIEPAFTLVDSPTTPVTLSIPTSVGFMTDDFQGGDSGFGYASIGATASIGLDFVPAGYGDWSLAFNTTYYHTDEDVIPGNPEDDFLTGTISIGMAF